MKTLLKTNLLRILILFLFIVLIVLSCQHDESDLPKILSRKPYEKLLLANEPIASNLFNYVKDLKTDQKNSDSLSIPEEVIKAINTNGKTSYSFKIDLPANSSFFRNLVITKTIEGWVGYYLDYYPDLIWLYGKDSTRQINDFTGRIKKYDLYNNLIYIAYIKEGKMFKYSLKESKSESYCVQVTNISFYMQGIGYVNNCDPITSSTTGITYSECYIVLNGTEIPCLDNSTGSSGNTGTWPDGSIDVGTIIPIDVTSSSGTVIPGGGVNGTIGVGTMGTTQVAIYPPLPVIDASSLLSDPKMNCIYSNLVSTNLMSRYLKDFDGQFPVSHLKYELIDILPDIVNARTYKMTNDYWITIRVNRSKVSNLPVLEWVQTLIHETIHAEMFRLLVSVKYRPQIDFPGLWDFYQRYQDSIVSPQHEMMASYYIGVIVKALKEYDFAQNPDQLYSDLAWNGLQGTVAWNNLSEAERIRIVSSISRYRRFGNRNCIPAIFE